MRKIVVFDLILISILPALDSRLAKADYYYANNHLDSGYLAKAGDLCDEVLGENPFDAQALWRMARLSLASAEGKSSKKEKLSTYETALGYAKKAREADSGCADAYHWYGVILGRTAQERGIINFLAQIMTIKESFETAVKIDPNHTGALHGLGIWYAEASNFYPQWTQEAVRYLGQAIASDPSYTLPYVTLARVYIREKDYSQARKLLESCLAVKNPTVPAEFANYDRPEAQKWLKMIEGK